MMTRGRSAFTPKFSSCLAPVFARYVELKQALGRCFDASARTLQCLDRFLCDQNGFIAKIGLAGHDDDLGGSNLRS